MIYRKLFKNKAILETFSAHFEIARLNVSGWKYHPATGSSGLVLQNKSRWLDSAVQQWERWRSPNGAAAPRKSRVLPGDAETPQSCPRPPASLLGQNKDILVRGDWGRIPRRDRVSRSELRGWGQLCLQWLAEQIIIETEDLTWPCRKKKLLWEGKKTPFRMGLLLIAGAVIKFAMGNLFKDYFSSDFFALCKSNLKGIPFFQASTNIYICSHEQPLSF